MKGFGCEHNNMSACQVCLQGDAYYLALTMFLAGRYVESLVRDSARLTAENIPGYLKELQRMLDERGPDVRRILGQS